MTVNFKFPKKLRLLTPSHFRFVFQHPKRVSTSQIYILGRLNLLEYPRIGLALSKKNIKYAHERNRIRRLIRESFRLNQNKLPSMDFIIVAKKGISNLDNHTLSQALEILWNHYYRLAQKF